ncbi:hypothetical protein OPV22_016349 [Ensete ventricosum]|uniref:Secreted protein n=1 Tax=Ensete ventricosum TaxID=4639 RepID=A0AAV8QKW2_ENSVE|nr:hypothetical protein OPV22_016349 [Ensete ventricosum]
MMNRLLLLRLSVSFIARYLNARSGRIGNRQWRLWDAYPPTLLSSTGPTPLSEVEARFAWCSATESGKHCPKKKDVCE